MTEVRESMRKWHFEMNFSYIVVIFGVCFSASREGEVLTNVDKFVTCDEKNAM